MLFRSSNSTANDYIEVSVNNSAPVRKDLGGIGLVHAGFTNQTGCDSKIYKYELISALTQSDFFIQPYIFHYKNDEFYYFNS